MSDLLLQVEPPNVELELGRGFSVVVYVTNQTGVSHELATDIVGLDPAGFVSRPETLGLDPRETGRVVISGQIPELFPSGRHVLGIRVASRSRPDVAALVEIELNIPSLDDVIVELAPSVVEGGRAKTRVRVRNRGAEPVQVQLSGSDPEGRLDFEFDPHELTVDPDRYRLSRMRAKGKRKILGEPVRRKLHVVADAPGQRLQVIGTFVHKPWIPRHLWLIFLAASAALVVILSVLAGIDFVVNDTSPTLSGRVTDAAVDGPLPDVLVVVNPGLEPGQPVPPSGEADATVVALSTTDRGGRYQLFDVPSGNFRITFVKENFNEVVRDVTIDEGQGEFKLDTRMVPRLPGSSSQASP